MKTRPPNLSTKATGKEKGALAKVGNAKCRTRCATGFHLLGVRVWSSRRTNELGFAPVYFGSRSPFMLFSPRESNFYAAVWETIMKVLFGI
jgi:hypothetical protein